MITPLLHPNAFRIERRYFTPPAPVTNFSYVFSDNNVRDLISLRCLATRNIVAGTPVIGAYIFQSPNHLTYHFEGHRSFDVGDPFSVNLFAGAAVQDQYLQHGSLLLPIPSPCWILPNDLLCIYSDFPPAQVTFDQINATFKLYPME